MLCRLVLVAAAVAAARYRDVITTQGRVRGYRAPRAPHYAYLGLPYAAPTRHTFKAPEPPKRWDGIFEATHRVLCLQPNVDWDINCLVLNVFTPEEPKDLPVLVVIHDGAFHTGWGSHTPPDRLLEQDIIVVTINYRLGALGFLCLGTSDAPGNAGVKDQVAALYWVHKNVMNFGGNPHDVTVYGIGSGAVSIQLLLMSGATNGMVHKAILEAGSILSPWSVTYDPVTLALEAAYDLGYQGSNDVKELNEFYKRVPFKNLANMSRLFSPCVENEFSSETMITQDPLRILEGGKLQHIPLLIVYESGSYPLISQKLEDLDEVPEHFDESLPNNLKFNNDTIKCTIAELIKNFYFVDNGESSIKENYVTLVNDIMIEYPIVKSALLHAIQSPQPVYLMHYSKTAERPLPGEGCSSIMDYFFSNTENKCINCENAIIPKLLTMWSNFIKLGDPTPLKTSVTPVMWQTLVPKGTQNIIPINKISFLHFGKSLRMQPAPSGQRLLFWDHIYREFYKDHKPLNMILSEDDIL